MAGLIDAYPEAVGILAVMRLFVQRFPCAVIVLWSLAVHVPYLTSPLLDYHAYRQTQTASMARNYVRHGMHFFTPELDNYGTPQRAGTEFPIYSFIVALLYKVFGAHEILGRLLSIALTAWSAIFLFRLVQPRLGERVAFWSALAMCTIPVHIYFTRSYQPESMAMWGFLGSILYLDRELLSPKNRFWILAVILGSLGPLLKLPFLYLVLGVWAVLGIDHGRPAWRSWRYWLYPVMILMITGAWYHYAHSAPDQVLPLTHAEQMKNLAPILTVKFWVIHFIQRFPEICMTYTGLVLALLGAWQLRTRYRAQCLWTGWFFVTVAYTVLLGQYGIIHKYTDLPWAPIDGVLIGMGIAWLLGKAFGDSSASTVMRPGFAALAILFIVGMPVHAALRIGHWYNVERTYLYRAKATLDRVSQPTDLVLTNTEELPVLLYTIDRYGYAFTLDSMTPAGMDAFLKTSNARFFLTPKEGEWTAHPEWSAYFSHHATLIQDDPEFVLYRLG